MKKNLLIFLFALTCLTTSTNAQWVQSGLTEGIIKSIASNGNYLYVGRDIEGLYQSIDNGNSFIHLDYLNNGIPSLSTTFRTAFSGASTFAANQWTSGLAMYKSINNGITWTPDTTGIGDTRLWSVFAYGNNIFAGGQNGTGVFLSTDDGASWSSANNGINLTSSPIMDFANIGSTIFCGDGQSGVYKTTDYGASWTPVNNGLSNLFVRSLAATNNKLFVALDGDGIFQSDDDGANWTHVDSIPASVYPEELHARGSFIFAAGFGIYFSKDNGVTWTNITDNLPSQEWFSVGTSSDYLFIGSGGDATGVYKRTLASLVGIEELDDFPFTVSPNPSAGKFDLENMDANAQVERIVVYNSLGENVREFQPELFTRKISVDLSDVPNGLYYVQVSGKEKMSTRKVLLLK